jgi:hypothetical protein
MASIEDKELVDKTIITKVVAHFKAMKPLVDFLNRAIDT